MKVAVIDNYDSFVHNLVRYLEEAGCEVLIQRNDALNFAEIDECTGIVLSPGPGIPSEAGQMFDVIKRYYATKKILGVCLGHQALAECFGGRIEATDIPIHGKSSLIQQRNKSVLFNSIPSYFEVGRYHSWCVTHLPEDFEVTSVTATHDIMSMEHKSLPIFGVQFHPESILTPSGRTLINNWINA